MNKKGKNKKGKVPNPTPSQPEKGGENIENVEVIGDKVDLGKTSEVIEIVEEKIESVKEDRVPEIVSEIITPAVDTKDEETPKKPKRNRGKKKKGKEDDFEDTLDEGSKETGIKLPVKEAKVDTPEMEKEPLDMPNVTPTARKKKNKKKNVDQKTEEPTSHDLETTLLSDTTKDKVQEPVVTETPIKEEMPTPLEPVEQVSKPSKKKNKKKKRNDSEKSDKEEISCTAAFHKLIDVSDEPTDIKPQKHVKDTIEIPEDIKFETETKPVTDLPPELIVEQKDTIIPAEEMQSKEKEIQQIPASEDKSKKKNKKDKKHIPKPEEKTPLIDEPVLASPLPEETIKSAEILNKDETNKDSDAVKTPEPLVETDSPKPKAKIAKPVEKKRKGKQDTQAADSLVQDNIATEAQQAEQFAEVVVKTPDIKDVVMISEIETKKISEETSADVTSTPSTSSTFTVEDFEPLNLTDKAMGKKRKKGPKIPKTPDVSFEILEPNIETDTKEIIAESIEISKGLPTVTESVTSSEKPADVPIEASDLPTIVHNLGTLHPPVEPSPQTGIKDHVLLTPELTEDKNVMKADSSVSEKADDTQKFETKSSKKRKKSPKPPKKDMKPETENPAPKISVENLPKQDITKEMGEKIDASNITKMYDIEISSIKADESEGSVCDTVPDVTYPRASSQQLTDDNNNDTVIREIFPVSEIIPNISVEGITSQKSDTDITSKDRNVSPPKDEKTDIKSKMMEVNQDMEELRLSIERSLAELTAMEKGEEAIETQFEQSKAKTEQDKAKSKNVDTVQIKDEHEKIKEISDAEKSVLDKPGEEIKKDNTIQDKNKTIEDVLFPHFMKDALHKEDKNITKPVKQAETKTESIVGQITTAMAEVKDMQPVTDIKIEPSMPIAVEEKPEEIHVSSDKKIISELVGQQEKLEQVPVISASGIVPEEKNVEQLETESKSIETKPKEEGTQLDTPPVCPARKDHKNKHKKKKGKQDSQMPPPQPTPSAQSTSTSSQPTTQETKKEAKTDNKNEKKGNTDTKEKGKQQASDFDQVTEKDLFPDMNYEPIDNFEDALTSSVDDVNKTFEMIVTESQEQSNPKINIIAPDGEKTPVSPPKNLLGHPDIPVPSSRRDFKKEKNKIPNEITAKVKIKDSVDVEKKQSKNTQTINKLKDLKDCRMSDDEEFVYKYSFRKVFLQTACHVCKKDLAGCRVACCYCNLVFYCGIKHKDEDWPQHQALCFAVSTIGHLKDQKHIYGDAKNLTGHDYRLIRMQMIVSCEKVLKRRLVPWEQEALLYPRMCAYVPCREWRQMKLSDCQGCGQISYCTEHPEHLPKSHARWCKSYSLYQKLVCYQQTKGRLEPKLPTKVMQEQYEIPEKINEVLAGMYEEKIDMNDIQYAALTQIATAPLTAAYCHQLCRNKNTTANGYKTSSFTIHVVGAELQFEADALNKWEVFFLHLRPDLQELRVVLINYNLNPSNLPLELLGKIKLCENCRQNKRRVILNFQDKRTYADYKSSEDFVVPDIVCAFNPSIQRSSVYNGKDPWPSAINIILKQKIPFIITAYTITELHKDCIRIKECSETGYNFISEPKYNNFASVRPDRNFISDDEMPLLFKNYCFAILSG